MTRGRIPPFETEIVRLGPKGVGIGYTPEGRAVRVRGAPPGARVAVRVFKRAKGVLHAARTAMIRPPLAYTPPACPVFGLCGGCTLQELALDAQRAHKHAQAVEDVGGSGATVHPPRGAPDAYGYRNKVELSFGVRRYLSEAQHSAGLPIDGRFLGFHAPGRFDRVVDTDRCAIASEAMNGVVRTTRQVALPPDQPPPYDVRTHLGFWRHLVIREGVRTGELLVVVHTTSQADAAHVTPLAEALLKTDLGGPRVVGVIHRVFDGVADMAGGDIARVWGQDHFHERLRDVTFRLSDRSFFQTSTAGAEVLYETIGEALGHGGTLVDLYCGAGAIGLVLAAQADAVLGLEEVPEAVDDARANATANGIEATFRAARVEDALGVLDEVGRPRRLVVDPPRVGLHPRATTAIAAAEAEVLVYVACNPASLGRDRPVLEEGGWRLTDIWTVDLFPQTGHVEAIGRFVRTPA